MKSTVWCTALAASAILLPAVSEARERHSGRPDLELLWSDPQQLVSPGVVRLVEHEITRQLRGWGVDARWGDAESGVLEGVAVVRVVIVGRSRLSAADPKTLGMASLPGSAGRVAWVLFPSIVELLGRARSSGGFHPSSDLARAIARVALHELVHALAPGLPHARSGLMRARLAPADLLAPFVPLDGESRAALLSVVLRTGPRA